MASVYRLSALRTICGFRTISDDAAGVIAGAIPIDILADEMSRIAGRRAVDEAAREQVKKEERSISLARWQNRWNASPKGRWTYRLLPDITIWYNRKVGELNFYITQFLTGHGVYRNYLYKYGHDDSPLCPHCDDEEESAEHVFFHCPRFPNETLRQRTVSDIMEYMVQTEDNWGNVNSAIVSTLAELRRIEQGRRQTRRMSNA